MNTLPFALLLLIAFAATAVRVEACSTPSFGERPMAAVSPGMYILVGEVIGYTEPVTDPQNFRGSAVGIRLRPIESIQFPHDQRDYVEVFIFGPGADCFPVTGGGPQPKVGSRLRLALHEARLVANRSAGRVRLERDLDGRISPDEPMFGFSTKADTVFDYKRDLLPLGKNFAPLEMWDKRSLWLHDFLYFESAKDVLRFERATSEKERMELLERLLHNPVVDFVTLLYSRIGAPPDWHLSNLARPGSVKPPTIDDKKLSKRENELLAERMRLEASGELNYSKNWITH